LTVKGLPRRVLSDQKAIWTSPARLQKRDLRWILPLGATLGVLIGTDEHVMTAYAPADPALESHLNTVANAGFAMLAGLPVAFYASTLFTHNERARETGIIGVEAVADAAIVGVVMKFVTQRERPYQNLEGRFWNSPSVLNSSFPSEHSLLSWTAATVIAEEYPRPLTRWLAYGLAAAVSGSRVAAERHFPSDAVIGIAAGYLIGHYVFKAHHDRDLAEDTAPVEPLVRVKPPSIAAAVPSVPTR
jgi:membrane-associated phospholipid phosphatase